MRITEITLNVLSYPYEHPMEFKQLGSTGTRVSPICLGTMTYGTPTWREWVLDEQASRPFMRKALDAGLNFFDTADMYSMGESERVVGRALLDYAAREDFVLATKVYNPMGDGPNNRGLSRKHIMHAIDAHWRVWGPTTSTSTRFTASTTTRRSRNSWKLCTM